MLAAAGLGIAGNAWADTKPPTLSAERARLALDLRGGAVTSWQVCRAACDSGTGEAAHRFQGDIPVLALVAPHSPGLTRELRTLEYRVTRRPEEGAPRLSLRSAPFAGGHRIEQTFELRDSGRRLAWSAQVTGEGAATLRDRLAVRLATGSEFAASPSAGFTGWFESVRVVAVAYGEVRHFRPGETWHSDDGEAWTGIRNRFWSLLARAPGGWDAALSRGETPDSRQLALSLRAGELRLELFAGPVEPAVLGDRPGGLEALWISGLWEWLRLLAKGLYFLLEFLYGLLGDYGLAILALALVVKLLMLPLTLLAARWQRQVNEVQAAMRPALQRIKADSRGEQQANRVLALHREHGVTLWYPLKSLFGVLIQLPVFVGVFDMLLYHPGLVAASFLWIEDLARPDHLAALGFSIPFFGSHLNLLPFLMTGVNLASARLAGAAGLDSAGVRRRRWQLSVMAAAFFLLFYTFPAGMVLYWTSTNLLHLIGELLAGLPRRLAKAAS